MKTTVKKIASVFLAALFAVSLLAAAPVSTAADADGVCGDTLTWIYTDSNRTLTISGSGDMYDFTSSDVPWKSIRSSIRKVIVGEDVTSVGNYAFYFCTSLTETALPAGLSRIGDQSFANNFSLQTVRFCGTSEGWSAIPKGSGNSNLTSATLVIADPCDVYGHDVDVTSETLPDCTSGGVREGVCRRCGGDIYSATCPNGHSFGDVTKIDDAHYTRSCAVCGAAENFTAPAGAVFTVTGAEVGHDRTFTVPVYITGNPGIWAAKIYVYYDPALTATGVSGGPVFTRSEQMLNGDEIYASNNELSQKLFWYYGMEPGNYKCVCGYFDSNVGNRYESGVLMYVTFKAPAEAGEYTLGVIYSPGDTINDQYEDVPFENSTTNVTVLGDDVHRHEWDGGVETLSPTTDSDGVMTYTCTVCGATKTEAIPALTRRPGDVNGDGKINSKDISLMKRYFTAHATDDDIVKANTDVNGDGKINSKDLAALKRILANGE